MFGNIRSLHTFAWILACFLASLIVKGLLRRLIINLKIAQKLVRMFLNSHERSKTSSVRHKKIIFIIYKTEHHLFYFIILSVKFFKLERLYSFHFDFLKNKCASLLNSINNVFIKIKIKSIFNEFFYNR